jgi:integrase/recombinase XerD
MARRPDLIRLGERYLALRRTAGFKLDTVAYSLRSFARFAVAKGDARVRRDTAIEWANAAPSRLARHNRLQTVVRFARHACVEDPAHEVPPGDHFGARYVRRPPHIFSNAEIALLLRAADALEPRGSLRSATFRTLIGLLAVTGLRVSEARGLLLEDVHREDKVLFVRQGKCGKSRAIPVHPSTLSALDAYIERRLGVCPGGTHVFVSSSGTPLSKGLASWTFAQLRRQLPAARSSAGHRHPRLHDLRHTFAVRALEACPSEGRDRIGRHMQAIAQYLGHTHLTFTYWYFESTARLMKDMADAGRTVLEGGLG